MRWPEGVAIALVVLAGCGTPRPQEREKSTKVSPLPSESRTNLRFEPGFTAQWTKPELWNPATRAGLSWALESELSGLLIDDQSHAGLDVPANTWGDGLRGNGFRPYVSPRWHYPGSFGIDPGMLDLGQNR